MIAKSPDADIRDNYLTHSRGISSWIFTLDHKRIGVMYLCSVLVAFLLGGLFAMLIRAQLLEPDGLLFHKTEVLKDSLVYKPYNQIFTVHGAVMIFLVLIPGIPGGPGQFRPAAHAGGQGRRLSAAEPLELLLLRLRHALRAVLAGARRGRHGLDVLHALQRADVHGRDRRRLRGLPAGLQLDLHRLELHRHDPQAAAAGHDLVPHAAVLLGPLRHGLDPDPRHARAGDHAAAVDPGAAVPPRAFSIRPTAATRSCSSTSSGSIRTRPSTS